MAGAYAATMPCEVIKKRLRHPLTDIGLERFLADWRRCRRKTGSDVTSGG